jgi:hypothetical protein
MDRVEVSAWGSLVGPDLAWGCCRCGQWGGDQAAGDPVVSLGPDQHWGEHDEGTEERDRDVECDDLAEVV